MSKWETERVKERERGRDSEPERRGGIQAIQAAQRCTSDGQPCLADSNFSPQCCLGLSNSAEIARIEQKLFEQQTGTESSADSNSRSRRSLPCARSSRCFASRGGIHWSLKKREDHVCLCSCSANRSRITNCHGTNLIGWGHQQRIKKEGEKRRKKWVQ